MGVSHLEPAVWRKSSYSGQGGNCLEVMDGLVECVPVRDSKKQAGPALAFPVSCWAAFVAALKRGDLTA